MTTKPLTNKDRIASLEDKIGDLENKIDLVLKLLKPKNSLQESLFLKEECKLIPGDNTLIRKPIMYLYNMTGALQNITVDFGGIHIEDAIPEIREDGKISFNLDSDSYINSKYKYLYYELGYDKPWPKPAASITLSNDKVLSDGLSNLAIMCGLWSNEVTDFVAYWELELKRSDCKYWKCDIYTEKELNPIIPISIFPEPGYFIRRYVRFSESDTGQKINNKFSKDIKLTTPHRTGSIRVVEWGGLINDANTII